MNFRPIIFITAVVALAEPCAAQPRIPALVELPPAVAAAHHELVAQREALVQERQALHAKVTQQQQRCSQVDKDSPQAAACASERTQLNVEMQQHAQRSNDFNQAANAAIASADDCSRVPSAQAEFIRLGEQVAMDRQILQNFGFERTVNDMESWAAYAKDAQDKYVKRAKQELLGKTLQGLQSKLKSIEAPPPVSGAEADAFRRLFESAGVKDQGLLNDLRMAALGQQPVQVRRLTGGLERAEKVLELMEEPADLTDQIGMVLNVAHFVPGTAAPLLSIMEDANWIGYAAYTQAGVAHGLHDVDKLTTLTEGQLKDLAQFTPKLKRDVDGLHAARKILESAKTADCDSSKLVR